MQLRPGFAASAFEMRGRFRQRGPDGRTNLDLAPDVLQKKRHGAFAWFGSKNDSNTLFSATEVYLVLPPGKSSTSERVHSRYPSTA